MYIYETKKLMSDIIFDHDVRAFNESRELVLSKEKKLTNEGNYIDIDKITELVKSSLTRIDDIGEIDTTLILPFLKGQISTYVAVPKLCVKNYVVKLQYMSQFLNNIESAVAEYVKHEDYSKFKDKPILTGSIVPYVKRQIYIPDEEKGHKSDIDNALLIINNFDSNRKAISNTARKLISMLKDVKLTMVSINNMLNEAIERTENDDAKYIQLIKYTVSHSIYDVLSYVSILVMDLLNRIYCDYISLGKLDVDLRNEQYKDQNILESTICTITNTDPHNVSSDFIQNNVSAYIEICNNIIGLHNIGFDNDPITISKYVNSKKDIDSMTNYQINTYLDIAKVFMSISTGLDIIGKEGDEYMLIFKDVLTKSGLSLDLGVKYGNEINEIDDLSRYNIINADDVRIKELCDEVAAFIPNIECLSSLATDVAKKIDGLRDRFENSVNREYVDTVTVQEITVFLDDFKNAYMDMCTDICRKFLDRLQNIDDIMKSVDTAEKYGSIDGDVSDNESIDVDDYTEMALLSIYKDDEDSKQEKFHAMEKAYYKERMMQLRGVNIVYEDENNTTSPTVIDNSSQQQQTAANSANNITDKFKNAANNMGSFIKMLLDKFTGMINRLKGNVKWIQDNEAGLNNRSYDNVTIKILPYGNIEPSTLIGDISKLTNNVKSLNPQVLNAIQTKDDLYRKLFPFIPGGVAESKDGGVTNKLTTYYKVRTAKMEVVEMRNEAVKSFAVSKAIPYVKNYNDRYVGQLKSELTKLSDAVDSMNKTYSMTPQQQNQQETKDNMSASIMEKSKWITAAVKTFSGIALNVSRDRYNDYMKVLKALAPSPSQNQEQ